MQLSRPGTHGSRGTPGGSSRACLTAAARLSGARSSQRRRSTAISVPSSAIGRPATASRKFFLYWTQSQTTRSLDRSADEVQTASMIGPSADRAACESRSFLTARRSTSMLARLVGLPGTDASLVGLAATDAGLVGLAGTDARLVRLAGPDAARLGLVGLAGTDAGLVQDAGHRLLVPRDEQVHPGHALDAGELLHGLGRQPR